MQGGFFFVKKVTYKLPLYFLQIRRFLFYNKNTIYTILDHTEKKEPQTPSYSFSAEPSNVKFKQALKTKSVDEIILLIDELLEALEVLNPRLYRSFINKL